MADSVRDGAQMSRPLPQILPQPHRNLTDFKTGIRKASDHFGGKLHATALKAGVQGGCPGGASQSAMKIFHVYPKSQPAQPGQQGHAQIPMADRHGARSDATGESVANNQIPPLPKPVQNGVQVGKIVASVTVADDDVPALCGRNTAPNGIAVPLRRYGNDGCTGKVFLEF